MKSVLTTALSLICTIICIANPIMRTYHKRAPLKGPIKTVRSYGLMTTDEAEVRLRGREFYNIDSFSNTGLKLYSYWGRGSIVQGKSLYRYNAKGKMTEECHLDDKGVAIRCDKYTYDTSGNLLEESRYWAGLLDFKAKYIYADGLLISKEDSNHQSIKITKYQYDDNRRMVGATTFEDGGLTVTKITGYRYDDKGRMIEVTESETNAQTGTQKYTYYDNGDIRSEVFVFNDQDNHIRRTS